MKRIRDDRSRLLWKMRLLPNNNNNQVFNENPFYFDFLLIIFLINISFLLFIPHQATLIQSALQAIVSDELTKINRDLLWEYDGLPSQPECEDILLQMQTFFYQDLMLHQSTLGTVFNFFYSFLPFLKPHFLLNQKALPKLGKTRRTTTWHVPFITICSSMITRYSTNQYYIIFFLNTL